MVLTLRPEERGLLMAGGGLLVPERGGLVLSTRRVTAAESPRAWAGTPCRMQPVGRALVAGATGTELLNVMTPCGPDARHAPR